MFLKLTTFYVQTDLEPDLTPLLIDVDSIETIRLGPVVVKEYAIPPSSDTAMRVLITTKSGDTYAVTDTFDEVEKALKKVMGGTGHTVLA